MHDALTMSPGRNDPCPCGSGKKYKRCCLPDAAPQTPAGAGVLRYTAGGGRTRTSPRRADATRIFQQALAYHQAGQLPQARTLYQKVLKVHPRHADAIRLLGAVAYQRGELADAERLIRKALEIKPDFPEAYSGLGVVLQEQGRIPEAVECLQRAVALKPDFFEAHSNLGLALKAQGHLEEAIACHQRALAINPNYPDAYNNLGVALRDSERPEEAAAAYQRAIALKPGYAEAYNNLGVALKDLGRLDEAAASYQKAIAIRIDYAEAYTNLGMVQKAQGKPVEAVASYRRALALRPDLLEAYLNLAGALKDLRQFDEAVACYKKAIAIKPDYAEAYSGLGSFLRESGKLDEAVAYHEQAFTLKPDCADAYRMWAHCKKCTVDDLPIAARVEALLAKPDVGEKQRCALHYALGKIYDDLKQYDQAFMHYHRANQIDSVNFPFDRAQHSAMIDGLIQTFTPEFFDRYRSFGSPSDVPMLVMGMMRSGTTLVEQIISSHPQVYGAGELSVCEQVAALLKPDVPHALTQEKLRNMAESYLNFLRVFSPDAPHIIDKLPLNFLNLGYFHLLFPQGRMIHCMRNPVDTCLSIYFHKFGGYHPYAYDLENLAFYYREYLRLMQHWRSVLPPGIFMEVQYEELVADQEAVSRKLIAFCGLEWDERCLEFYKNERPVSTASSWQVRQPIYTSSTARWKRYEPYLGPLAQLLEGAP